MRSDGGFVPSQEVKEFLHFHSWKPEEAPWKLAPLLRDSWIGKTLVPKLRFRDMAEDE